MGTSISQPSPSGTQPGAPEWKATQEEVSAGTTPSRLLNSVYSSYAAEYGPSALGILCDEGVRAVELVFKEVCGSSYKSTEERLLDLIKRSRAALAEKGVNSFFSELCLKSASRAISNLPSSTPSTSAETSSALAKEFTASIVDYSLSRDLPTIVATVGIKNPQALDRLIGECKNELSKQKFESIDEAISARLNLARAGGDE